MAAIDPTLIIAVDFDGVIHDYKHPVEGKRMGPPLPGALNALEKLHDDGYIIIIYTVKARTLTGREAVEEWLDHYGFDYHDITAIKPNAAVYIDDRAVRHTDWDNTMEQLTVIIGADLDRD